jgi:Spy/CpxP family protein refolding chaperone
MRLIVAAAAVVFATTGQLARAQGGGGDHVTRTQAALFSGITLTDAQRAKVDSIAGAYRASAGGASADRQQMRESRQREVADLRSVLTSDQQPQFDKNLASIRSGMGGRRGMRDSASAGSPR